MRILPFEAVSRFHNHLANNVTGLNLTEETLEIFLSDYAQKNNIDPEILKENYIMYALMLQLDRAGLLDEVLMAERICDGWNEDDAFDACFDSFSDDGETEIN